MSDSGGAPDIPDYPGVDRPGGPGAEAEGVVADGEVAPGGDETAPSAADEADLPSEMEGR
jgi:hypothetical protein